MPGIQLSPSRPALTAALAAPSLPDLLQSARKLAPLPASCSRILRLLDDPEVFVPEIAVEVEKDHTLAATVLRLANSPLYRAVREVGSVKSAVGRIGLNGVREIVATTTILRLPSKGMEEAERIRRRMLATAVASRLLAEAAPEVDTSSAFISGLLLDIGRFLLLVAEPANYLLSQSPMGPRRVDDVLAEEAWLGFSNADVAAHLVEAWNFPESICDTIQRRYQSDADAPLSARLCQAADRISERHQAGDVEGAVAALQAFVDEGFAQGASLIDSFFDDFDAGYSGLAG